MKVAKLHATKINKFDTCLSYAYKRIGIYNPRKFLDYESLLSDFEWIKVKSEIIDIIDDLKSGDLLLQDNGIKKITAPTFISENGIIQSETMVVGYHIFVVEENNLFSDLTRTVVSRSQPSIRIQTHHYIDDISHILRLKTK